MKLSAKKIVFAVVLVALIDFTFQYQRSADPVYLGRRLSEWLPKLIWGWPEEERAQAATAIATLGVKCVPFLLNQLEPQRPLLTQPLRDWFTTNVLRRPAVTGSGLSKELESLQKKIWTQRAFEILGPEAKPALPRLTELLADPITADGAADALASIGPGSLPVLRKAIRGNDVAARRAAARSLGKMKQCGPQAAQMLWGAVSDLDPSVRLNVESSLRALAERGEESVLAQARVLEHGPDPNLRYTSLYVLKFFKGASHSDAPDTRKLCEWGGANIIK